MQAAFSISSAFISAGVSKSGNRAKDSTKCLGKELRYSVPVKVDLDYSNLSSLIRGTTILAPKVTRLVAFNSDRVHVKVVSGSEGSKGLLPVPLACGQTAD